MCSNILLNYRLSGKKEKLFELNKIMDWINTKEGFSFCTIRIRYLRRNRDDEEYYVILCATTE
jgi:hypothetical protein